MAKRKLSRQQQARIRAIQARRRESFEQRAEAALEQSGSAPLQEGLVVTRHGQNLAVADQRGKLHHCLSRQNIGQLVCGDRVIWQVTGPGHGVITAMLERSTALIRPNYSGEEKPLAANIQQLVAVLAPRPPPNQYLLDQYLITAEHIGLDVLIALNKCDLLDDRALADFQRDYAHYKAIGYPLIQISAKREHGLAPLTACLRDRTSILVGQSGVGKSSLIKTLLPDIQVQIGRLSTTSGLGKHTTSATTLYRLPQSGALIDSPGVRSFRLSRLQRPQLEQGFREFGPFLGHCRFSDCSHREEPGCALVAAVAEGRVHSKRLENFRHMAQGLDRTA